jgi:DNA-binding NarL/FixJ family response regulator
MTKIRVLLAEDHVVVREGTRELMRRERDME